MDRLRARLAGLLSLSLLVAQAPIPTAGYAANPTTTTPIQHVVVIFQENVSFDHYFGTYPNAANLPGEPAFQAAPNTPAVNGLTPDLLNHNPNSANPHRLSPAQAVTCDMDHDYTPEQKAVNGGKVDQYIQNTTGKNCGAVTTMDYYDGNTVTALWTYAQNFALSDNHYSATYGPSTPGVLNLVSGQTHGTVPATVKGAVANNTDYGDADPTFDDCSAGTTFAMTGKNVGDLLNAKGVTWGWFEGGFKPTSRDASGKAICGASTKNVAGATVSAYSAHHQPFEYYQSTSNPHHLPPTSVAMIGQTDQANHQYDLSDFWDAANSGNLPAVSYLKAPRGQDGHPSYSSPLDEQMFLVNTLNQLQKLPTWSSTAVIITWDDSDGWYDHVAPPQVSSSNDPTLDFMCGTPAAGAYPDRCGFGPRIPLLVISPYAKANYVDHTQINHASILKFIEENWQLGSIGDQSFDANAGQLNGMFDFGAPRTTTVIIDPAQFGPAPQQIAVPVAAPAAQPTPTAQKTLQTPKLPNTGGIPGGPLPIAAGAVALLFAGYLTRRVSRRSTTQ